MSYTIDIEPAGRLAERLEPYTAGEYESLREARLAIARAKRRLNTKVLLDVVRDDGKRYRGF
jgi:hypothetical protein